jgi:hypothetical protein
MRIQFIPLSRSATLLCCVCLLAVAGAVAGAAVSDTAGMRDAAAVSAARSSVRAALAAARNAPHSVAGAPAAPNEIVANPDRAYPASCLADGLPFGLFKPFSSDPTPQQQLLTLPGDPAACAANNAAECGFSETDTITVWRVPCSGGKSATLLEIDRPCGACATTTLYPTFPLIRATQGNNSNFVIRIATDANTVFSTSYVNDPVFTSNIFVLENYLGYPVQFDYNKAFSLSLDNAIIFNFGDYNPAQYSGASAGMPITGYLNTNWYDPNHGGEGMLTQIYESGDGQTRPFTAAWYTFDSTGRPFWLYAQGGIAVGARTTGNIDTYYASAGGFAGGFGASATFTKWGTTSFSFPNCGTMTFTFNGQTDATTKGPGGSGTRTWTRLADSDGQVCQ